MTWILLRAVAHTNDLGLLIAPHTKRHDLQGVSHHTNHLDFAKGGSYKQPRFANGFRDRELSRQYASKTLTRTDARTSFCHIHHRYENPLITLLHRGYAAAHITLIQANTLTRVSNFGAGL